MIAIITDDSLHSHIFDISIYYIRLYTYKCTHIHSDTSFRIVKFPFKHQGRFSPCLCNFAEYDTLPVIMKNASAIYIMLISTFVCLGLPD